MRVCRHCKRDLDFRPFSPWIKCEGGLTWGDQFLTGEELDFCDTWGVEYYSYRKQKYTNGGIWK